MLVFFVILAFLAEGFCEVAVIEKPPRPRLCGENELYVKCRTICQPQFCNASYTTYECDAVQKCEPGCDCIKDHLRDNYGRCVPIENCPPPKIQCGENQVPSDCADNYSEFPKITLCRPGCKCIENYSRNSYDECVPTPPLLICPENEEAATCKKTCPPQVCAWDPTKYACKPGPCQPGCNCKKGYLRDESGKCIPQEICPPILPKCGDNEEPTDCAKNIRPFDSTLTIKCRPCQCIEGYVRDINGVCVLSETPYIYDRCTPTCSIPNPPNCPQISDTATNRCNCSEEEEFCKNEPNTIFTLCPNRCKSTCKNPNGICSADCREGYGCGCKPGFLLSEQGKCILPEDCPGGNPCGKNETFVYCKSGCPTAECPTTNSRGIIACSPPNPCPSGCACKKNYKRQKDGLCILASECPPVKCADDEIWDSCPAAGFSENCNDKQAEIVCKPLIAYECQPQCVCKKNYRRNSAGKCIPISQCPPQCGENEEPTDCSDTYQQPLYTDVASQIRIRCQPGCKCIAGYIRDSTGACVRKQLQCGINEEPNVCIAIFPSNCPPCRCIANYQRNKDGFCVPAPPVPQCGINEEPNDCSVLYPQPDQLSLILIDVVVAESIDVEQIRIRCQPCKCIKGYERNNKGVCVPIIQCGENEEFSKCKQECPPQYCSWDSRLMDCRPVKCKAGCNCIKGYLRDANGICIPREQCPECNGDKNAIYTKCPNQCVSTCKNPNAICSEECGEPFGCKCKYGYILSEEGRCILPQECPGGNPCGRNETFFGCVIGCPTNTCPRDDSIAIPQCLPRNPCPSGCACKSNYKRVSFEDKRCILASDCSPIKCTRKNEVFNRCPSACFWEGCGSPQLEPKICNTLVPNVCRPRCVCKKGFRRDSSGYCIPKDKCPPQCGENEELTDCSDIYPQLLTTGVASENIGRCQPGCTCIAGYMRDSNGVCVLIPKKCKGKHETLVLCPSACFGDGCGELDEDTAACNTLLPTVCKPRCMCRKGYRRDIIGNCIRKEKCPAVS